MQERCRKRRTAIRQEKINATTEMEPESPAKKRRRTFLVKDAPKLAVALRGRIGGLASAGDVSMTLYAGPPQRERRDEPEMVSFYVSRYAAAAPLIKCHRDDEDYVLETVIEELLADGLVVERYPPRPESPRPLIRVAWLNL
jgi:hypothetical protein